MKKILNLAICVCLLFCVRAVNVSALSIGPYTGDANTYYINPDTGVTDDGGSKNVAVGEGMCRSVIGDTALVEYDGNRTYITLRVLLLSNIRNLKFAVQQIKGDNKSYEEVTPDIMAEDAENDCADYRFAVPQNDSYIRCTAYIIPMSRDVTFYLNVSNNLSEGGGDFVVSVEKQSEIYDSASAVSRNTDNFSNGGSNQSSNSIAYQAVEAYDDTADNAKAVQSGTEKTEAAVAKDGTKQTAGPNGSMEPSPEADEKKSGDIVGNKPKATRPAQAAADTDTLSTGGVAAIIFICIVILALAGAAVYFFVLKRRRRW